MSTIGHALVALMQLLLPSGLFALCFFWGATLIPDDASGKLPLIFSSVFTIMIAPLIMVRNSVEDVRKEEFLTREEHQRLNLKVISIRNRLMLYIFLLLAFALLAAFGLHLASVNAVASKYALSVVGAMFGIAVYSLFIALVTRSKLSDFEAESRSRYLQIKRKRALREKLLNKPNSSSS
ncbi:hypothetical protein [Pseudoalteromonas luteoviolacea]|uniref:Uncharacterized protein n=1 Tax=Pseudoalteromonas luteoviolacea S4054 TaxID=1129367 RepID=A0A0F6ADD5_9GAMM|nr:hypothetical protein [Pseudoalteromonas luteoviolacea]AOT08247.1 hypothetical protein S4054249_10520 [Pseudoalteromonas luteoviolacea]AOT13163.1 hypothetical protein S40542_10495 [Pseudoalteromonas luteoviolacea]AOT18075.1 hypothetical protein S4054_10490 [Pseudoalteromonas luteoviolacea]KKE84178.1 hypothetical protein N479_09775 [Pseudoalteromonas luteoviolacea S4054]KZN76217.1 hypothetical protein N481_07640 [Pseudoalteromonas luteoviolacea S4047-1]